MKKLTDADVTPEELFNQRRKVLKTLGITAAALTLSPSAYTSIFDFFNKKDEASSVKPLMFTESSSYHPDLPITPEDKATSYNNFYEFGLGKSDPAAKASRLKTAPWTLKISGEVVKPIELDVDDIIKRFALEERIYRLRCVEAWSMVIPWIGFQLNQLIALAQPTSKAKFVAFQTLYDPEQMPGQKNRLVGGGLPYPYVEGLRMDEAMHPLTLISVGAYGKTLQPQNGAPIRLVVPWKYGFKSIKSIVEIRLTEQQPPTSWNLSAPHEYGFYANVNPDVSHPRWSQATERVIGASGLLNVKRQPTLLFNGYADRVAQLYRGMDLKANF